MLKPKNTLKRIVQNLDGFWDCEIKEENRPIAVPGSWNEQYQDLCYEEGPFTYKTTFYVP
ncbi:MAG: Beta-glucuronidase, partial [Thermotoga sp. 47_83]